MVAHANDELSWAGSIDGGHSTLRIAAHVSNLSLRRLCVSEAQVGVEDPDIAAYIRVSRTLSSDKVQELNDDPFANYIFEAFAAHPVNKSRLHLF